MISPGRSLPRFAWLQFSIMLVFLPCQVFVFFTVVWLSGLCWVMCDTPGQGPSLFISVDYSSSALHIFWITSFCGLCLPSESSLLWLPVGSSDSGFAVDFFVDYLLWILCFALSLKLRHLWALSLGSSWWTFMTVLREILSDIYWLLQLRRRCASSLGRSWWTLWLWPLRISLRYYLLSPSLHLFTGWFFCTAIYNKLLCASDSYTTPHLTIPFYAWLCKFRPSCHIRLNFFF